LVLVMASFDHELRVAHCSDLQSSPWDKPNTIKI
jgi:hypothetical protein